MSQSMPPANASMNVNYGEQMSELARKLETNFSGPVDQIPGATPVHIHVADVKLGDSAPEVTQAKPSRRRASKLASDPSATHGLHSDGLISDIPMVDMSQFESVQHVEPVEEALTEEEAAESEDDKNMRETYAAVEAAATRNLTNAQIIELCAPFYDGSKKRPTFISRPILNKVYIGTYPAYGEILTAETMLGSPGENAPVGRRMEYSLLAELASVIKGFIFAHDPMLAVISMYPYDYSKWPKLYPASFLTALHPSMREVVFPQLSAQYVAWKVAVTPSTAELEKYYGLIGQATS